MLCVRVPLRSWKAKATRHERALTILLLQVGGVARARCQMPGRALGEVAGFLHGLPGGRGEHLYCCIALPSAHLSLAAGVSLYYRAQTSAARTSKDGFIPSKESITDTYKFSAILIQNLSLTGSPVVYSLLPVWLSCVPVGC